MWPFTVSYYNSKPDLLKGAHAMLLAHYTTLIYIDAGVRIEPSCINSILDSDLVCHVQDICNTHNSDTTISLLQPNIP